MLRSTDTALHLSEVPRQAGLFLQLPLQLTGSAGLRHELSDSLRLSVAIGLRRR